MRGVSVWGSTGWGQEAGCYSQVIAIFEVWGKSAVRDVVGGGRDAGQRPEAKPVTAESETTARGETEAGSERKGQLGCGGSLQTDIFLGGGSKYSANIWWIKPLGGLEWISCVWGGGASPRRPSAKFPRGGKSRGCNWHGGRYGETRTRRLPRARVRRRTPSNPRVSANIGLWRQPYYISGPLDLYLVQSNAFHVLNLRPFFWQSKGRNLGCLHFKELKHSDSAQVSKDPIASNPTKRRLVPIRHPGQQRQTHHHHSLTLGQQSWIPAGPSRYCFSGVSVVPPVRHICFSDGPFDVVVVVKWSNWNSLHFDIRTFDTFSEHLGQFEPDFSQVRNSEMAGHPKPR
ncbi:hypothetical protein C8J57DRAFT_1574193 [Mycena rebaudengoi]|nr:hypothetical protein C8J57DRAFT_1574193 [Mycena rebaudengoi]